MNTSEESPPAWSREEFEQKLHDKGKLYHIHHPLHIDMNNGLCTQQQIQGWVANRFYYQISIPVKDANVLANCPDRNALLHGVAKSSNKSCMIKASFTISTTLYILI